MDRVLTLEFVRVTEAAAVKAGRPMRKGDKMGADQLAVDGMHPFSGERCTAFLHGHCRHLSF